jgi:hypothetical protein
MDIRLRVLGDRGLVELDDDDDEAKAKAKAKVEAEAEPEVKTKAKAKEFKPFFDAPMERAGVGNMSTMISIAAFGLGGLLATGFYLGIVDYMPFPWLVIDICVWIVFKGVREFLFDRWLQRAVKERKHLRASRGLFFGTIDFFLSVLFGAAFALISLFVTTTIDWTSETALVQICIAAYLGIVLIVMLQLPMISGPLTGGSTK